MYSPSSFHQPSTQSRIKKWLIILVCFISIVLITESSGCDIDHLVDLDSAASLQQKAR